ncbi:mce related protein [Chitinimonas prasina]|uniref:Mce related protein n=1 Tax=Chitinimonas prasina TaxID=1434937 RepID=A0ABQ5YK19_9NEIS|nr:MlaD family protein [Chitinimonas prasina]GLR14298.1 mce related protein [Chitinimonas prasina]
MLLRDNDPRFRALPWKLALFGLAALISSAAILLFLAIKQGYFEAKTPISFISDSGNDLKLGMAVKFSGFKIGEVTDLSLDANGPVSRVRISVLVEDRHLRLIKPDSVGRIAKDGLIGDGYIDVGIGSATAPPVERDAELEFVPAKSLDEIMREVRDRAMPVINEVETMIQRVNDPQGDLHQTLKNLRTFSAGLNETRNNLDQVLISVNQLTGKEVPATLATTRQALERADASLQQIEQRMPGLLDKADRTLGHLEAAGNATNQLVKQIGPDAVGLVHEGRELSRKGNETIDAVTGAWPLNKLITPPTSQPPRSDSQGVAP